MNDLAGWQLRGGVRALRREVAEWDAAVEGWKAPFYVMDVRFRPDGRLLDSEFHNRDGSIARQAYVYDDAGRLIESQSWMDEGPRRRVIYGYDERGRQVDAVAIDVDGARRRTDTWHYDEDGRKSRVRALVQPGDVAKLASCAGGTCGGGVMFGVEGTEHGYSCPGAVTSTTVYDERDLAIDVTFHDAEHALLLRVVLSRDDEGRLLREQVLHGGERPAFFNLDTQLAQLSDVDRAGIEAELAMVFANQIISEMTYAYDALGRLIERVNRMGTLLDERTTFRYDDFGNQIEEITESHDREVGRDEQGVLRTTEHEPRRHEHRFEYEYDAHGNWTARTVSSRLQAQAEFRRSNVERRAITYY